LAPDLYITRALLSNGSREEISVLVKDIRHIERIHAADHTELREILHPDRDSSEIRYSIAHAVVAAGEASVPHRLTSSEVYYVLSGLGEMHVGDESRSVQAGHAIYVPPNSVQWIENTGASTLAFLCIVDPAWREDQELAAG
jgi:mannose-6-phosphate isomerase-like protein (cupin superfamily)